MPRPPPASPGLPSDATTTPRVPSLLFLPRCSLSLSRTLFPPPLFSSPSGARRRRLLLPRPPPSPHPSDVPESPTFAFYASSTSQATGDAPYRRHRHHLQPRAPPISVADMSSTTCPRAQRDRRRTPTTPPTPPSNQSNTSTPSSPRRTPPRG